MQIPLKLTNPASLAISLAISLVLATGTVEAAQVDGAYQQAETSPDRGVKSDGRWVQPDGRGVQSDGRWVQTTAAISPALNYSANLPMQQCLPSTAFDVAAGFTGVPLLLDCITPARAEAALILGGTLDGYDRSLIQQCLHDSGFDISRHDGGFDISGTEERPADSTARLTTRPGKPCISGRADTDIRKPAT